MTANAQASLSRAHQKERHLHLHPSPISIPELSVFGLPKPLANPRSPAHEVSGLPGFWKPEDRKKKSTRVPLSASRRRVLGLEEGIKDGMLQTWIQLSDMQRCLSIGPCCTVSTDFTIAAIAAPPSKWPTFVFASRMAREMISSCPGPLGAVRLRARLGQLVRPGRS